MLHTERRSNVQEEEAEPYSKRFGKERPDVVLSIEAKARRDEEKWARRREAKRQARQAEKVEEESRAREPLLPASRCRPAELRRRYRRRRRCRPLSPRRARRDHRRDRRAERGSALMELPDGVLLDVPETNILMLIDLASSARQITQVVEALDTDKIASSDIQLYSINHSDPEVVAEELNEIFSSVGYSSALNKSLTFSTTLCLIPTLVTLESLVGRKSAT